MEIGVFVNQDSYLESFELSCELHTLKQQVAEYVLEEAIKEEEKRASEAEMQARTELLFEPTTDFADRWQAVVGDILLNRHPSQLNINQKPDEEDENTTDNF